MPLCTSFSQSVHVSHSVIRYGNVEMRICIPWLGALPALNVLRKACCVVWAISRIDADSHLIALEGLLRTSQLTVGYPEVVVGSGVIWVGL
jgi:hypothetical protein